PAKSTTADIAQLTGGGFVAKTRLGEFAEITGHLLEISEALFKDIELIRIHGDCHNGNLLQRPEEGIMIIDFDDMMTGPPVQDIWLLLYDYADRSQKEINLILQGYEQFREFDDRSLKLIEPLRAMRMLYYLAWCSKQVDDFQFNKTFPDWGSDAFWQKEISDLQGQLQVILEKQSPVA
ncbi:phosphotransferase, partial [bacterium]|nr:phosphotransferase [bacterium]